MEYESCVGQASCVHHVSIPYVIAFHISSLQSNTYARGESIT